MLQQEATHSHPRASSSDVCVRVRWYCWMDRPELKMFIFFIFFSLVFNVYYVLSNICLTKLIRSGDGWRCETTTYARIIYIIILYLYYITIIIIVRLGYLLLFEWHQRNKRCAETTDGPSVCGHRPGDSWKWPGKSADGIRMLSFYPLRHHYINNIILRPKHIHVVYGLPNTDLEYQ